jgi:hypothetical protein
LAFADAFFFARNLAPAASAKRALGLKPSPNTICTIIRRLGQVQEL